MKIFFCCFKIEFLHSRAGFDDEKIPPLAFPLSLSHKIFSFSNLSF